MGALVLLKLPCRYGARHRFSEPFLVRSAVGNLSPWGLYRGYLRYPVPVRVCVSLSSSRGEQGASPPLLPNSVDGIGDIISQGKPRDRTGARVGRVAALLLLLPLHCVTSIPANERDNTRCAISGF